MLRVNPCVTHGTSDLYVPHVTEKIQKNREQNGKKLLDNNIFIVVVTDLLTILFAIKTMQVYISYIKSSLASNMLGCSSLHQLPQ